MGLYKIACRNYEETDSESLDGVERNDNECPQCIVKASAGALMAMSPKAGRHDPAEDILEKRAVLKALQAVMQNSMSRGTNCSILSAWADRPSNANTCRS